MLPERGGEPGERTDRREDRQDDSEMSYKSVVSHLHVISAGKSLAS